MKVLLLNQTFYPDRVSTAQQLLDIALFLRKRGCHVTVVTDRRGYEDRHLEFPPFEVYEGIEIHRVLSSGLGKGKKWRRLCDSTSFDLMAIQKLWCLSGFDVVICFTSPPLVGFLGVFYSQIRNSRTVQWLMDVNPEAAIEVGYLQSGSLVAALLTRLFRLILKKSDHVIVLDRFMQQRIIDHGLDGSKITVIPPWSLNAFGGKAPSPTKKENAFAKEHGLVEKFVILYSGNFSIAHPLDTMLEAAVRLKEAKAVQFVFVGGGLRAADIDRTVEKHGLRNVLRLPWQPQEVLRDSLGSADLHVVVMGNRMSGLAHTSKIYGVLATGKPYLFVGPKESHVGELLDKCPHGFHVDHGDVEGFLGIVERVMKLSPDERRTIAEANQAHVHQFYSPEHCLEPLSSVIFC